MFRIGRSGLLAAFGMFIAASLTLVSLTAEAGQVRRKFKGGHSGSVAFSVGPHVSGQRSRHHRHDGAPRRDHAGKHWGSNGWDKGWSGDWKRSRWRHAGNPRYGRHGWWNGRQREDEWSDVGSATVVTGESYPALSSGPLVVEGNCAVGEYCTIRLGPYGSSPKIITLSPRDVESVPVR